MSGTLEKHNDNVMACATTKRDPISMSFLIFVRMTMFRDLGLFRKQHMPSF